MDVVIAYREGGPLKHIEMPGTLPNILNQVTRYHNRAIIYFNCKTVEDTFKNDVLCYDYWLWLAEGNMFR